VDPGVGKPPNQKSKVKNQKWQIIRTPVVERETGAFPIFDFCLLIFDF
jgi:hypothetical protein